MRLQIPGILMSDAFLFEINYRLCKKACPNVLSYILMIIHGIFFFFRTQLEVRIGLFDEDVRRSIII